MNNSIGERIAAVLNQPEHTALKAQLLTRPTGDEQSAVFNSILSIPEIEAFSRDWSGAITWSYMHDALRALTGEYAYAMGEQVDVDIPGYRAYYWRVANSDAGVNEATEFYFDGHGASGARLRFETEFGNGATVPYQFISRRVKAARDE